MAQSLVVGLPPGLVIGGGYKISVTALDPATGATVAGVKISDVTLEVDALNVIAEKLPPVILVHFTP